MTTTRRLVHVVRRHYFILEALPEVLESVLNTGTLEHENVLNQYLISKRIHLQFEAL